MHSDHENARGRVRAILAALEQKDTETITAQLLAYRDLLSEHIKKEDDILYRWMDRNLTPAQLKQLTAEFEVKEREFGDAPQQYEVFVEDLEQQTRLKEWQSLSKR
jgi:hemerythrin-like domain-containing protein